MKIIVVGGGAWGTALAVGASSNDLARHAVTLWVRDPAQGQALGAAGQQAAFTEFSVETMARRTLAAIPARTRSGGNPP